MNSRNLDAFIAAAEHSSITAAAESMFISSPALQQQLNRLEKEVGFKLLDRGRNGISLTAAGAAFLAGVKRIRGETEALLTHCREIESSSSRLRVGAILGLKPDLYPRISGPFRRAYPHVIQEPVMENEDQLFAELDSGALDAIEYYECPKAHAAGRSFLPLIWEGRDCLMAANHPLADRKELTLDDLRGQQLTVYRFERIPGFREYVEQRYPDIIVSEAPRMVDFYTLVRSFEDHHVSLVPPHCEAQFQPLTAVPLKLDMRWPVGLVYREPASPALLHFFEVARRIFLQTEEK